MKHKFKRSPSRRMADVAVATPQGPDVASQSRTECDSATSGTASLEEPRSQLFSPAFASVALIGNALYVHWLYPSFSLLAAVLLVIVGVCVLLMSRRGGLDNSRFPVTRIHCGNRSSARILFGLFVCAPILIGLLGVIPLHFAAFTTFTSALVLWSLVGIRPASPPTLASDPGSRRVTAAWFSVLVLACGYFVLLAWPLVASRRISCPASIATALATFEQAVVTLTASLGVGRLSSSEIGNSTVYQTRSQHLTLVGGATQPRLWVLNTEHMHLLLMALLLLGSLLRSLFILEKQKIRSVAKDVLAVAGATLVYLLATWLGILSGDIDTQLWPYRIWSALCLTGTWYTIRYTLEMFGPSPVSTIHLRVPNLQSVPVACAGLILAVGSAQLWQDPGERKPGRVVIDEFHSDWEKADLPMVKDVFGVKTVYNYGFFKEFLEKHFSSVRTSDTAIDSALLDQTDVLILKTPTKPYSPEEVAAVRQFVESGGGLWLIGDHTNIFGMNTYLNQVGSQWGIYFNADAVSPLPGYYQQVVSVPGVPDVHDCGNREHETLASARYLNHPIIGHRLPFLAVLTSCSVSAPWNCEAVSISRGTFVDHPLFGGNTFFGNLKHDHDETYGCVLQNVAVRSGRGRVATWSDSTLFSNFSMCMTGVPDLALGYVEWLNRRNVVARETVSLGVLALITAIAVGIFVGRHRSREVIGGLVAGMLMLGCFVPLIDGVNSRAYPLGDICSGFRTVGFDQQYSCLDLPNRDHVHRGELKNFESLYVLMQRLHLFPQASDRLKDLVKCDTIIMVNPTRDLDQHDIEALKEYLHRGGAVVLMAGRTTSAVAKLDKRVQSLNRLLEGLALRDRFQALPRETLTDFHGPLLQPSLLTDAEVVAELRIDDPQTKTLLRAADGNPLVARRQIGEGNVILCAIPELFSNANLGEPGSVPNARQELALQCAVRLVSEIIPWEQDQKELKRPWDTIRQGLSVDTASNSASP
jgi:hypothetical protein